jgi:hypothetical protein
VRGDGAGLTPASFRFQRERGNGGGDDADGWGPACQSGRWAPLSAGEGRESTDLVFNPEWAMGSFPIWAERFPGSILFLLFSFSFF